MSVQISKVGIVPLQEERQTVASRLEDVVSTEDQFMRTVSDGLPVLLDRATVYIKRFLRETGKWRDDVAHEKFVLRWAAEYLERFMMCGKTAVPCRPLFLFDSIVAHQHSRPQPFCYHPLVLTPLGRFLDALAARACVSRDALIGLYYHCYGLGPADVIAIAGLSETESPRIYKNLQRWRESGWHKALSDAGLEERETLELAGQLKRHPERLYSETLRILPVAQAHYRKSEPDHYPCRTSAEWQDMMAQGYGVDYRIWHLAFCLDCLQWVGQFQDRVRAASKKAWVRLHVSPQ